jgi:hypoxanthine phosphoribosyltransferase
MTTLNLGNKILLVDDLVDSGASLEKTITWLNDHYPNTIKELKTAVIWYKSCSNFAPDYYVDYLRDNPWLVQPFEKYEKMNIQDL